MVLAIRSLRHRGIDPAALDLFSEEPVDLPRGILDRPSRMSLAAVLGAIGVGSAATLFVYWAQGNYRVVTGGMPIFSFWATGVITYEMTMLGAIVVTFAWFLRESGLLRRRDPAIPIPEVEPGSMCLRVQCTNDQIGTARDALRAAGAIDISERGAR